VPLVQLYPALFPIKLTSLRPFRDDDDDDYDDVDVDDDGDDDGDDGTAMPTTIIN
jgi:hypothetical protein